MVDVYINGENIRIAYNATMDEKSLVALLKPVPTKDRISNKTPDAHGKQVVGNTVYMDERDVSLTICIKATSQYELLANWKKLVNDVMKGTIVMQTDIEPNVKYRLDYKDCKELSTFFRGMARFTFTFNEPDPSNRA